MDPFSPRTRRTLVLTTAAAVIALTGCSSGETTTPEPSAAEQPQPRVVFQGQGKSHLEVVIANLDGSDITYPFSALAGGDQTNPDWSPDGTRVVFIVNDGVRDDLWVMDADGSKGRRLLDCAGACRRIDDPAWSPSGSTIVFSRTVARDGADWGSLETVHVDTGGVTVVLPPSRRTYTAGARWSPDSSHIVFESVHVVAPGLDAEVDGVTLRIFTVGNDKPGSALTDPELFAATADWSPDGEWIVYSALARPDSGGNDLFVISPDGGEPRQVTRVADAGGYADEPAWRADNNTIVFSGRLTDRAGSGELLTVTVDGSDPADMGARPVIGRHPRVEPGA